MKSFTLFTTDVMGKMNPKRPYTTTTGRYEVIPAGGGAEQSSGAGTARAILEYMAQLAQAAKAPARACRDSSLSRLDRAIDALEHSPGHAYAAELAARSAAIKNRPVPDAPGAGPSAWELMTGKVLSAGELDAQRAAAVDQDQVCREAEAAYAARNPHKAGLLLNEDKVTKPSEYFADAAPAGTFESRCRASQAAYAARNPHKRGNV